MLSGLDLVVPEKRRELDAVLRSREFLRSPALARLLEYLCEKVFTGKIQEIKEFSIATEVFGRDDGFGEKRDSLVRVEVHRLRKKLHRYYETEGSDRPVRIVIRPGSYQPEFERVSDSASGLSRNASDAVSSAAPVEPPASLPELLLPSPTQPALPPALPATAIHRPLPYRLAAIVAGVTLMVLVAALAIRRIGGSPRREPPKMQSLTPRNTPGIAGLRPVRILAGSTAERSVDRFGTDWGGDRYFIGGHQDSLWFGNQERSVRHPIIAGAADQTPFRNFRAGDFSYRIPLAPGAYELRLYFAEVVLRMTDSGDGAENQRVFDVFMNGAPLLSLFDIFSDAGGADMADIRVFENVSPDATGFLNLDFRSVREAAWLNAIELIPNDTSRAFPLRIVAKDANYTDRKGQIWGTDRYHIGGKDTSDDRVTAGTDDPDLYAGQRYGHFSYRLPVPAGKYKLRLLFSETFFGKDNRGKGGIGSRIFNVYCGGTEILHQFDILKEAGENRAIEKVFHGITPNAQGRIDLDFEPVVNYAKVQAIELMPDDRR
jgi:hypothetical protein